MENTKLTKERVELKRKIEKEIENRASFLLFEYKRIRDEVFGENFPKNIGFYETDYKIAGYVEFGSISSGKIHYRDKWGGYGAQARFLSFPESYLYSDVYEEVWRERFTSHKQALEQK
ncbi:MAG TPA: hypothetical protein PLP33_24895 [Leptospiraceae bacterium]|nr:hypothetical protein [Leptospiraceae bacterium]